MGAAPCYCYSSRFNHVPQLSWQIIWHSETFGATEWLIFLSGTFYEVEGHILDITLWQLGWNLAAKNGTHSANLGVFKPLTLTLLNFIIQHSRIFLQKWRCLQFHLPCSQVAYMYNLADPKPSVKWRLLNEGQIGSGPTTQFSLRLFLLPLLLRCLRFAGAGFQTPSWKGGLAGLSDLGLGGPYDIIRFIDWDSNYCTPSKSNPQKIEKQFITI